MPKTAPDDPHVPMDVMQPQRIKVLEATLAQQVKQLAKQSQEIRRLRRALAKTELAQASRQSVDANRSMLTMTRGRRPRYTREFLLGVWKAHEAGETVASIAARLEADASMMKIFLKGDYWTEAAKTVYAELGIS